MKSKRNDGDRDDWVQNDEGLYNWWKGSGLSRRAFIRANREEIDKAIDAVEDGSKPAHHLAYPSRPRYGSNALYRMY